MKKVDLYDVDFDKSIFEKIDKDWMLVTAGTRDNCNTMTASWGGLGVLWKRNVATIYVRPERYTLEFIEKEDYFSLAFFGKEYRNALNICGTKSGRDMDKIEECGFTVSSGASGGVYFEEADIALICRKIYSDNIRAENMIGLDPGDYYGAHGGVHRLYIGEIVEAYVNLHGD